MQSVSWSWARKDAFRAALLRWYDAGARELPWRRDRDPYRVWVSEVMLQQTRVPAVLVYYERFLARFPTLRHLARARLTSVLAAWSGLGYYRRARMMHQAARRLVREHGGRFPDRLEGWRALPGVGRYTAAAVCSIALGARHAVVDGNVERVLARLLGRELSPGGCWDAAQELLSPGRPGDHNQAMMELGATVCLPGQPRCGGCPVRKLCATRGAEPRRRPPERQRRELACSLALRDGAVLLVQRPADARVMPGMWELPEVPSPNGDAPLLTVRHAITTTDYTVAVYRSARGTRENGRWVPLSALPRVPLTGLARKVLRRVHALV